MFWSRTLTYHRKMSGTYISTNIAYCDFIYITLGVSIFFVFNKNILVKSIVFYNKFWKMIQVLHEALYNIKLFCITHFFLDITKLYYFIGIPFIFFTFFGNIWKFWRLQWARKSHWNISESLKKFSNKWVSFWSFRSCITWFFNGAVYLL